MNNINAIVMFFDGNTPSGEEMTAIAKTLARPNMRMVVTNEQEIAACLAKMVADKDCDARNPSEELNQCLIYIGEKYSLIFSPRALVTNLSHDLGSAYLRVNQFGAESELSTEAVALIRAVKTLSTTKYSKLSRELCSKYNYSKETHSLVNQIYSLYKNV